MFFTNNFMNDIFDLDSNQSYKSRSVRYYNETTGDNQVIAIAVPGFQKSDIEMNITTASYTHNTLNITTCIEEDRITKNPLLFNFRTKFAIAKGFNLDNIKANIQDGILTITIPKSESVNISKSIQID